MPIMIWWGVRCKLLDRAKPDEEVGERGMVICLVRGGSMMQHDSELRAAGPTIRIL